MSDFKFIILFFSFLNISLVALSQNKPVFLDQETAWADSLLKTLSSEERIAQLFVVAAYSNKDLNHRDEIINLIENYKIGGLMFLQGGPVRQAQLTNLYQSRSNIPLMIAIDGEWGVAMRLDSCLSFPWQMTLGAIEDTNLIYQMGVEIARQCRLLGIHVNFAPVVDVNSNPENPIINNRSFGENPQRVSSLGVAYMKGMQDNNVLACAKHFPGHGDTNEDSHKTLPIINHSKDRLNKVELIPFKRLINNGLGSIMIAHLNVPSLDSVENISSSLSPLVVNDLLKRDLNFDGLAITDALNMKGVSDFYEPGLLDVKALLAGNDILLFSEDVPKAIAEIKKSILNKEITQKEIDRRCHKILMVKRWLGLHNYKPSNISNIRDSLTINQTELIDKQLIQSSLTLLKNNDDLIPLKNLDTLDIAVVSIGEEPIYFQDMLSNYTSVKIFNIKDNISISEQAVLLSKLSEYNLVIASIHKSNANPWKSYQISSNIDILLQSIALQNKMILSVFANPYSINSLLFMNNFDAFLLAYQNSKKSQEETAKSIFGGIGISGSIPVSTNHFNINYGIKTNPIRINYVSPQEVPFSDSLYYKIDSIIANAINEGAIPGCQVLIAKDAKIFFNKSYGFHTYHKEKVVKNNDVYDLASITKIISTLPILMKMVDNKKIRLNNKLGRYLDLSNTNKKDLVLRDILAHQARLKPWIPFYKSTLEKDSLSGLMLLRDTLYSRKISNDFPHQVANNIFLHHSFPDSINYQIYMSDLLEEKEYSYSDLGYYLFKEIIEKSYNKKLDKIAFDNFYAKLGMENLGYLPLERIDSSRIIPTEHDFVFRSQLLKGYVHDMGAAMQAGIGGHAGVFSNANDLAKIMQMYLQKGEYAGERYLSKNVIEEFTRCQFCNNDNRRGLGFDKPALEGQDGGPTCECVSPMSFGHSGFTGTLAWADPETQIVYVFLSNRINPDATNKKLLEMNVRTDIMQVIFDSLYE